MKSNFRLRPQVYLAMFTLLSAVLVAAILISVSAAPLFTAA